PSRGSISIEQFEQHVRELKNGNYTVMPLKDVISAIHDGRTLPQNTVAITLEGGWKSSLKNAIPRLNRAGIPYTLFYASDMHDGESPQHMTWKDHKAVKENKLAALGILPPSSIHMAGLPIDQNVAYINKAKDRHKTVLGEHAAFFAYPYG